MEEITVKATKAASSSSLFGVLLHLQRVAVLAIHRHLFSLMIDSSKPSWNLAFWTNFWVLLRQVAIVISFGVCVLQLLSQSLHLLEPVGLARWVNRIQHDEKLRNILRNGL